MAYYQHYQSPFGDTTHTKIFVGGLAWETPTDVMRHNFEQFGDILEAVIITEKNSGKSKGYGFVTFRDPDSARKACENPNPMIDGRRANCNIASLGRPRPSQAQVPYIYVGRAQAGINPCQGKSGISHGVVFPPPAHAIYPPYGYTTYPPDYYYYQGMYSPQFEQAQYPFYYGYTMQGSRGTFCGTSTQQRFQGTSNYLYYPLLQRPSPTTTLLFPSSTTESNTPQHTSTETTEVETVTSESPNA